MLSRGGRRPCLDGKDNRYRLLLAPVNSSDLYLSVSYLAISDERSIDMRLQTSDRNRTTLSLLNSAKCYQTSSNLLNNHPQRIWVKSGSAIMESLRGRFSLVLCRSDGHNQL